MAIEEFEITVNKHGEVIVKIDKFSERRMKYYREMLEEILGPVKELTIVPMEGVPPEGVKLSDEKDKKRLRIDKTNSNGNTFRGKM